MVRGKRAGCAGAEIVLAQVAENGLQEIPRSSDLQDEEKGGIRFLGQAMNNAEWLVLAAAELADEPTMFSPDGGNESERLPDLSALCRLQSRQIAKARRDLVNALNGIAKTLQEMSAQVERIVKGAQGLNSRDDGSSLLNEVEHGVDQAADTLANLLVQQAQVTNELRQIERDLAAMGEEAAKAVGPGANNLVSRWMEDAAEHYTMESERAIHHSIQVPDDATPAQFASPGLSGSLGDKVELF